MLSIGHSPQKRRTSEEPRIILGRLQTVWKKTPSIKITLWKRACSAESATRERTRKQVRKKEQERKRKKE